MSPLSETVKTLWHQLPAAERFELAKELKLGTADIDYVSTREAQRLLLDCGRATLYRFRDDYNLKTIKLGGRTGWSVRSIKQFIEQQKEAALNK